MGNASSKIAPAYSTGQPSGADESNKINENLKESMENEISRIEVANIDGERVLFFRDDDRPRGELKVTRFTAEKDDLSAKPSVVIKDSYGVEQFRFQTNSTEDLSLFLNAINKTESTEAKTYSGDIKSLKFHRPTKTDIAINNSDYADTAKDLVTDDTTTDIVSTMTGIGSLSDVADIIFPGIVELSSTIPFAKPIVKLIQKFYTTYKLLQVINIKLKVKQKLQL